MLFRSVAVVTGAGRFRGIGRACALRLAHDGFAVVVHARTPEANEREAESGWRGAESVAAEIRDAGGKATHVTGDLRDASVRRSLVDATSALGEASVLVNNAGTPGEANAHPVHETPESVWLDTIDVNLKTVYLMSCDFVPVLRDSKVDNKAIVNFSSTAGHRPLARYGAYCASKAAVEILTAQQAIELARHRIRVNCVAPGSTTTDMIDGTLKRAAQYAKTTYDEIVNGVMKTIPMRRFAEPAEIANVVGFLSGTQSSFMTGQTLTVDGGMTLI